MKTMAEVLAEHQLCAAWEDDAGRAIICTCGVDLPTEPLRGEIDMTFLAAHQADALTSAGYGPMNAVAVVHVAHDTEAHDTEAHARSFNEGYETAMAQELADDPTTAQDWLDEKLANAKAEGWDECEVAPYEIRLEPGGKFWQPYKDNPYRSAE